ncbi:rhamnogalacturonidase [Sphingomonas sp. UNC305MFCol5.2]|uniref:rhamnogalacturonidase n=1 Tax=Sphingomonas sp. UNC305MFCol5.2 TaxID=1449076 RepID=UPI0004249869|nr:glycosyl hydrolase family 28-related protein [Sphingomonas sp. UNC305MFCol5.2]
MRTGHVFDVRDHGAKGDGVALDSPAINVAILAAEAAGGGMVILPPGQYLSFSIRLKSRVTLVIEDGATLIAAEKGPLGAYDPPEERGPQLYQDFGHSHWHNSLIWAEHAEDIAILGKGRILGLGLTRNGPGTPWSKQAGERPLSMASMPAADIDKLERSRQAMQGMGNKAIALAHCKRVKLDGFSIFKGGHFAMLASEVDGLDIGDLDIDTNRDGLDLDCVRRARIERCRVNTPNDDAIVLKTSLGLGRRSSCEDIEIRDCQVSGFDLGTMLDGTRQRTQELSPDRDRVTGRIKLGTESNGDFRRIRIANCRFERSRGLALETVDGGGIEDVLAENIEMTDVTTAPLFLRLGARLRGPEGTQIGAMRNIEVRGLKATGIDPRFAATLAGLPDYPIECVQLRDIDLGFRGGYSEPVPESPLELADAYPEPSMFGPTPAWGLWARHVTGLEVKHLRLSRDGGDPRPSILLDDTVARAEDAQYWPDQV